MSNSQQTPTYGYPISSPYVPVVAESSAQAQAQQSGQGASASASASATAASASTSVQAPAAQSRQAAEEARKDRTLADFMLMLDEYEPLVPLHIIFSVKNDSSSME